MTFSGSADACAKVKRVAQGVENFIGRWGIPILLLFAIVYYGSYYRIGFTLGGEGGLNAVQTMRLMEGQRPIVDTFLGYNLLWFYPLVALFKITGPDYVAMRVFFFAISTLNAILGFLIVRQVTRQAWLAMFVAVLLILVPGMLFRNYMGLIGVLSMFSLLKGYVLPAATRGRQLAWMAFTGVALSITFLIRIEPSLLLALIWLGLAVLYPFGRRKDFLNRLRTSFLGTLFALLAFLAIHGAFTWHAYQRGFGAEFVGQYSNYVKLLQYELTSEFKKLTTKPTPPAAQVNESPKSLSATTTSEASTTQPAAPSAKPQAPKQEDDAGRDGRIARPPLSKVWQAPRASNRFLGLSYYYPIFWLILFLPIALILLADGIFRGHADNKIRSLTIFTTTGCALVLFPQYFFFRPDPPHFSEFMVAFLPAVACSTYAVYASIFHQEKPRFKGIAWICIVFSALLFPLYMKAIMPREGAGTIIQHKKLAEFKALNNVSALIPPSEVAPLENLRDAVLNNSSAGEFVVCYPYAPIINFMTGRPSYEYDLYIDNTAEHGSFQTDAIERIKRFRPAVIVIDNRNINNTEHSRFKNWASTLMDHIHATYTHVGTFVVGKRDVDVYARPDKAPPAAK